MNNKAFFILILLFCTVVCRGQLGKYNVQTIGLKEGMMQTTVCDIAVDSLNFLWVSYPNGIQKYLGNRFINIPIQPGLPDDKWVTFYRLLSGDLLIAHIRGISRYDIVKDKFSHIYINPPNENKPPLFIGELKGDIWFYSKGLGIKKINLETNSTSQFFPVETIIGKKDISPNSYFISPNIHQNCIVLTYENKLFLWDLLQQKLRTTVTAVYPFFHEAVHFKSMNELYYFKKGDCDRYVIDFLNKTQKLQEKGKIKSTIGLRSFYSKWLDYNLLTLNNHVYFFDEKINQTGRELLNQSGQPITGNEAINKIQVDKYQNLYFRTISGGLKKITFKNNSINYYGTAQKQNNYVISILPDKSNNRILTGTLGSGLFVYDTLNNITHRIKNLPGKPIMTLNLIIKELSGDYLLYIMGETKIWRLNKNRKDLTPCGELASKEPNISIGYFHSILSKNNNKILTSSDNKYIAFFPNAKKGYINTYHKVSNNIGAAFYNDNLLLIKDENLVYIDTSTYEEIAAVSLKGSGGLRCFVEKDGKLYLGTNKGIFVINKGKQILQHIDASFGLHDECIYAMAFDKMGNLWCSSNRGIFCIKTDQKILHLTADDGLQDNEFNTGVSAVADDGEMFFGGINGVSSFYPESILAQKESMNLLVTGIQINHKKAEFPTASWNLEQLSLPWNQNLLSFDFIAMGQKDARQYVYQYKMDGIDDDWVVNKDMQTVRYHLSPGNYTFKVFASTSYVNNPNALKQINIRIHPPFYKTWWFIASLSLCSLGLMAFLINYINTQKHRETLRELQTTKKLQLERERISRDLHDNIGVYANTILYKTELLESQLEKSSESDKLILGLQYASKDIIASLRETVWALKKDFYSAEDCMLRIRNYVSALAEYYPAIHFSLNVKVPPDKILNHTSALNLIRIIQEVLNNSVKHANADYIQVISQYKEDWKITISDNGIGFDPGKTTTGNGLENIHYRSLEAGFVLNIHSEPNNTEVSIIII